MVGYPEDYTIMSHHGNFKSPKENTYYCCENMNMKYKIHTLKFHEIWVWLSHWSCDGYLLQWVDKLVYKQVF